MSGDNLLLLVQILYIVTALGTMFVVISENRNPVKTISWVLVLLLLPLVGLIVYYFFGEDNRKNRLISHKTYKKNNEVVVKDYEVASFALVPNKFHGLIKSLSPGTPLYGGNRVESINSGLEMFENLFEEINNAKHHIHIEYYIFNNDRVGTALAELLIKKAKEGVEVRVMYDDVGNWQVKHHFYRNMELNGISIKPFLPVKFRLLTSRVNYRNHRKIIIIDGEVGYLGGMNIADRYVDGLSFGIWRDTQIKIHGYSVAGLQSTFLLDWCSVTGTMLTDDVYYPKLKSEGSSLIQIVNGSPFGGDKLVHIGFLNAINAATDSILLQTPYFVPTDGFLLNLQLAAKRGVRIKLMIPKKSDTKLVHIASRSFLQDVISEGIEVFFFKAGFLHSKLLVIDDSLTITGSVNLDVRSFEHNFEIAAFIYSEETNSEAREIFYRDMENSERLDPELWNKRKGYRKFIESVMRLFSPLL